MPRRREMAELAVQNAGVECELDVILEELGNLETHGFDDYFIEAWPPTKSPFENAFQEPTYYCNVLMVLRSQTGAEPSRHIIVTWLVAPSRLGK